MDIKIIFYVGEKKDREFEFTGNEVKIGRSATCDIMVNDPMVSSHHLSILDVNGTTCVQDKDSINGTFLNGQPVSQPVPVQHGSEISFCQYRLEVQMAGASRPVVQQAKPEDQANKTMMISREDVEGLRKTPLPFNLEKKHMIMIGAAGGMLLLLIVLMLLPGGGSTGAEGAAPLKAGMLNTYFLQLDRSMREQAQDRNNLDRAKEYYRLGTERLKLSRLNQDAEYQALIYFYKSKNSMLDVDPRPPLWDDVNPKIAETEQSLKNRLRELFRDAWLSEKDGDRQGAIRSYQMIQEIVPEEGSTIYRTASFRIVKLQ